MNFIGSGNLLISHGGSGGLNSSWPSTWTVTFSPGGDLSGPLSAGQILPLEYDFFLQNLGYRFGWNLEFELGVSGNPALYGSQRLSGSESGSGSLTVNQNIASGSPLVETVVLSITGVETDFSTVPPAYQLNDPDFQFQAIAAPEPASTGLLAAGLGFLGWMFRRHRRAG
jgi:PEP-CTERM motif